VVGARVVHRVLGQSVTPRGRAVIAGVLALGTAAAALSWVLALHAGPPPIGRLVAAVVLVGTGDIALLRIRYGGDGNSFTWAEASLIAGAVFVDWSWLIAVGSATVLVRQLLARRTVVKAAWNAADFAFGAALGQLAYRLVTGGWHVPRHIGWQHAVGLVVAAAVVYFLWISVTVAAVVSQSQGLPFAAVWRKGAALRVVMFLGNSAAGLGVVLVQEYNRATVAMLAFFATTLYLSYNSYLRAQQERDTWRDLQRAAQDLHRDDPAEVARVADRGARALFGADRAWLVGADDAALPALAALVARVPEPTVLEPGRLAHDVADELAGLDVSAAVVAPLVGAGGALVLGFGGAVGMRRRELRVLSTYAGQVAGALGRARLFTETSEHRARLAGIVDSATDGILLLGGDGRVRAWNPAMAGVTGVDEADAFERPLGSVLRAATLAGEPLTAAEVLTGRGGEVVVTSADGAVHHLELNVSAVGSAAGRAGYAVVVARDVTAQRELELAKQDFVATVSHELRTPLTPIKGWLSLLLRDDYAPPPEQLREIHAQLLDQAGSLERLVEDLLTVSRMDRGHFDVRPEPVDAGAVVAQARRDLAAASKRDVRVDAAPGTAALADPARLRQVIANLLSNADKYTEPALPVDVTAASSGGEVRITVSDRGPGVPPPLREAVFEPFRRLGSPLTRETRGTGLGLHIARSLVLAMHGRIWVEDTPGGGATFVVVVPAAPALPPQGSRRRPSPLRG
jgi:PAS domain S-box-containing protein